MKLYCPNCGNKMNQNELNCSACGQCNPLYGKKIDTEFINNNEHSDINEPKILTKASNIGTFSILFSFSIPLIGIILSSIGLRKIKKIPSENKTYSTAKAVNNLGLILSIIFFAVHIIVFCMFACYVTKLENISSADENVSIAGVYNCQNGSSTINRNDYIITLRLEENKDFVMSSYNNPEENKVFGTYTYTKKRSNDPSEYKYYSITLNGLKNGVIVNGLPQKKTYYSQAEFGIIEKNNKKEGILSLENGNTYYCFTE